MASVILLAIESSCDETSASVIQDGQILSNIIYTQTIHEKYGGVVPESASRLHIRHILPVVHEAFLQSGITKEQLSAIAYTQSPGLIGSLLVGASFAKGMAQALDIPLIAVNHMQAHVLSNLIDSPRPNFPFLCLTVSGGHTQIVQCNAPLDMHILGESIDDAAGEAFDKAAKMLGLPYPGGPLIDKHARAPVLLADLGMHQASVRDACLVLLSKRDTRDQYERLHVQMVQRILHRVPVPLLVLADTDVHQRFPSAHLLEVFIADPHVPTTRLEQPVDVVVYLGMDVQVGGVADLQVCVGQ